MPPLTHRDEGLPPEGGGGKGGSVGAVGGKEEELLAIHIAEGIQPVASKIVQKVDRNKFVDFADLLQDA